MEYSIELEQPIGTVRTLYRYSNKTEAIASARRRFIAKGSILRVWGNRHIIWEKEGGKKRATKWI